MDLMNTYAEAKPHETLAEYETALRRQSLRDILQAKITDTCKGVIYGNLIEPMDWEILSRAILRSVSQYKGTLHQDDVYAARHTADTMRQTMMAIDRVIEQNAAVVYPERKPTDIAARSDDTLVLLATDPDYVIAHTRNKYGVRSQIGVYPSLTQLDKDLMIRPVLTGVLDNLASKGCVVAVPECIVSDEAYTVFRLAEGCTHDV